jgi:integrase/recombinase XerD
MRLIEGIQQYLVLKRSAGLAYEKGESQLLALSQQVGDVQLSQVTTEDILLYLNSPNSSNATWIFKYMLLMRFFDFWLLRGAMPELRMPTRKPRLRSAYVSHIYTQIEIRALLKAIPRCQSGKSCTIAKETLRALILLPYGTGAGVGEALRISIKDVDLRLRRLTIRSARFERHRTIPICPDVCEVIRKYLKWRNHNGSQCERLFIKKNGDALHARSLIRNFQRLRKMVGLTQCGATCSPPRMRDLTYTFAVHRIASWIRNRACMARMLPALAAYMGQVGLGATERYLLLTPERFRKELRKLSPRRAKKRWRDDRPLMKFLATL